MRSGIYLLTIETRSGPKVYIGQARDLTVRWQGHRWHLARGTHSNPVLQANYDAYGHVTRQILLICCPEKDILTRYEQDILNYYLSVLSERSIMNCHRQCVSSAMGVKRSGPSKILGRKLSAETIAKRTAKQKGRKQSLEERTKRSLIMLGRKASEETRAKISVGRKGWVPSPEHVEHLRRLAKNNQKLHAPETVAKRVATRKANRDAKMFSYAIEAM